MLRSLVLASAAFVLLGLYHGLVRQVEGGLEFESRRVARGAALAGANVAREALVRRWEDRRLRGVHEGGSCTAAAIVSRQRAVIRSAGRVTAGRERAAAEYLVRLSVERRPEAGNGRDPARVVYIDASPFTESS